MGRQMQLDLEKFRHGVHSFLFSRGEVSSLTVSMLPFYSNQVRVLFPPPPLLLLILSGSFPQNLLIPPNRHFNHDDRDGIFLRKLCIHLQGHTVPQLRRRYINNHHGEDLNTPPPSNVLSSGI